MPTKRKKNPAAVILGRLGGKAKVPKGFAKMARARLAKISRQAAAKRWGKKAG